MATRKSGIGQFGLERFKQGLEDVGVKRGQYEKAFETAVRDTNRPSPEHEEPYYPEEEREPSPLSAEELCTKLGISYTHCFTEYSPVLSALNGESTRVRTMRFDPDDDLVSVLTSILNTYESEGTRTPSHFIKTQDWLGARLSQKEIYKQIPGTITVTWVNNKPAWEYWNITLDDYMDFRQSSSPGRYLNTHLRSTSKGPI